MNKDNYIKIFDTTLRDGEQSPGCSMNLEEKLRMAEVLQALNVDIIEAGFAIASNGDFESVKKISAIDTTLKLILIRFITYYQKFALNVNKDSKINMN